MPGFCAFVFESSNKWWFREAVFRRACGDRARSVCVLGETLVGVNIGWAEHWVDLGQQGNPLINDYPRYVMKFPEEKLPV